MREREMNEDNDACSTWLVQVGSASEPLREPQIFPLDGSTPMLIGRQMDSESTDEHDLIEVPDRWMSGRHAEIRPTSEGWRLSDMGSSNGTLTWGRRRSTTLLTDGDVFETGSTFWVFRSETASRPVYSPEVHEGVLATISVRVMGLYDDLRRMAKSRVPLLIKGPTGCGKEVLARAIHDDSARSGPFVILDSGTIAPNLIAHELFGVLEGADVQQRARKGRLRRAHMGSLLIDQPEDMSPEVQLALLRAVQNGEVVPVGADEVETVDIRFICTTQYSFENLVESHGFRKDLASRLKGLTLTVPSLKERLEDLGLLVGGFLRQTPHPDLSFSPAAYRALISYSWPGNIRELQQTIESAAALCDGQRIELTDLPSSIQTFQPPEATEEKTSDEHRERELTRLLTAHRGNVSAVARSMGYSRMQVHRWMKQMRVDPNDYRA